MAKLANRGQQAQRQSGNRGGRPETAGFANLVVVSSSGKRIPLAKSGSQLYRSEEARGLMQALQNWILDNPEDAKSLTIEIDSVVNIEERESADDLDMSDFLGKPVREESPAVSSNNDETTNKLKAHFAK